MSLPSTTFIARARTDADDRLIEADEPLAGLQERCGGTLPGLVAIPELLELVNKTRRYGLRLARMIHAIDGDDLVKAWVEISPQQDGGCIVKVANWQTAALPEESQEHADRRQLDIVRNVAEFSARLDSQQRILTTQSEAPDLAETLAKMRGSAGRPWTDFVEFPGNSFEQPLHWRLLDGAQCHIAGSRRQWNAALVPLGHPEAGSAGFELYLVAQTPYIVAEQTTARPAPATAANSIGRDLSPVLRQPIARIIANAETIRTRLAGPLAEEYSNYAADIASAGQHLLSLIEDLADLEVVESDGFTTAPDQIDLADVARRAAGILGVRAQERRIVLLAPAMHESLEATAEFRRVLQILLNLVGNAIHYSPEGSEVRIELDGSDDEVKVIVSDNGPGLSDEQQAVVFEKFERLGRSGDGGSGLGLYISRRLARAMGGDLRVSSIPGEGASFILELPGAE